MTRSAGWKASDATRSSASSGGEAGHPGVARLAEPDDAAAEQPAAHFRQPLPDRVVARTAGQAGQVEVALRARPAPRAAQRRAQRLDVGRAQFHVGVHVDPREALGRLVPRAQRVPLGGDRDGQHPNRGAERRGHLRRIIGAAIGHHDHVQLVRLGGPAGRDRQARAGQAGARSPGPRCVPERRLSTATGKYARRFRSRRAWAGPELAGTDQGAQLWTMPGSFPRPTSTSAPRSARAAAIWHLAQVREHAQLGRGCIVGRGAYLGPGVLVGDNVKMQNYALVYEPARLEDGVFIGPAVVLHQRPPPAFRHAGGPAQDRRRLGRPSA